MADAAHKERGLLNDLKRLAAVKRRKAARNPLFAPVLLMSLVIIIIDQISKHIVLYASPLGGEYCSPTTPEFCGRIELSGIFDLTMVWNRGVSFGLFAGGMTSRVIFSTLSIVVAFGLLIWLTNLRRRVAAIGVGLIIGGALGNAYDRIVYGAVVDFLDFSGLYFPYVFNIADASINIGVACLAYDAFFGGDGKTTQKNADKGT
ncbi:MAG: signal peptidase II [Aquisalinus sp.]|nr:signal peptidase II [Aquisalinus sp.]